jgi:hypothetical protein
VLASLNHQNIAAIHGLEEDPRARGSSTALVLELVDGPTLADRLALGALSIDEALRIAAQVANALEAAHERGVVHRDLKPANIKEQAWALASRNRFVSLVRMTSGFSGQRTENLALMIPRQREMSLVRVKRGATGRDGTSEIPAMCRGNVAVSLSLPQQNRNLDGCEVEPPRARHEPHVPHGASRSLAARLLEARHEAVSNFRTLEEAPIGLRKRSGHPVVSALPAPAAHRPEVEPKQTPQNRRGKSGEPDHDAEWCAHRRKDARAVNGGHAAEQADNSNPVRNKRSTGGCVRRTARRTEHSERVELKGRG